MDVANYLFMAAMLLDMDVPTMLQAMDEKMKEVETRPEWVKAHQSR